MQPMVIRRVAPPPTIQRFAVRSPAEADAPRARRELNALRVLGAVLDQRAWWTEWSEHQWLRELEPALVRANVAQVLAVWPRDGALGETHALRKRVRAIAALTNQRKKKGDIEELLEHVLFPAKAGEEAFAEGGHGDDEEEEDTDEDSDEDEDEGVEGEDDSEDETALDEDGNVVAFDVAVNQVKKTHGIEEDQDADVFMGDDDSADEDENDEDDLLDAQKDKDPFGQIAWFVTMCAVREKLLALPPTDWTDAAVSAIVDEASKRASDHVVARTCALILAVVRAEEDGSNAPSLETVKAHVPEETRESVLRILQFHFKAIHEVLETTKDDLTTVLDVVVKRLGLPAKDEMLDTTPPSALCTPGPVPHSWVGDGIVSAELKAKLLSEIAVLANVPSIEKDLNGQVLELVDPSLHCGVVGQTMRLPQSAAKRTYGNPVEHFNATVFAPAKSKLAGPKTRSDKFQWLPCEVDVDEQDEGGNASILTYINNLHPEVHASLYGSLEQIFTRFVPLFETVISSLDDQAQDRATHKLYTLNDATLSCPPNLLPPGLFETSEPQLALKGTRCQVIIKVAEIHLTPKKPRYAGGAWHVEGTDAERIIATGMYYFGCENISPTGLAFRTLVNTESEQDDRVGLGLTYGLENRETPVQHLGRVTAIEDRCVVFPNIYQNKIEPFSLSDPKKPGVCKMLAFFLVDPTNDPIASTAVVPPQQQAWLDRANEPQMKRLRLIESVPPLPPLDTTREGMSLEQAKRNRTQLVAERYSAVDDNGDLDRVFSLSEL